MESIGDRAAVGLTLLLTVVAFQTSVKDMKPVGHSHRHELDAYEFVMFLLTQLQQREIRIDRDASKAEKNYHKSDEGAFHSTWTPPTILLDTASPAFSYILIIQASGL